MNDTWWISHEQLSEEQKAVISLPLGGSHLIVGPPGCGKTNLLLLRASYMARAGQPNILVLVFTKTLREFIAGGGRHYAFPVSKVQTCRKWQHDLLHQYGVDVVISPNFEEQRNMLNTQIRKLIDGRGLGKLYDAILLDEAQDYLPEEIGIFRHLGKALFAVADSRQKIYKGQDVSAALNSAVDEVHSLRYHYRCGLSICRLADGLAKDSSTYEPLVPTSNYDEEARPSSVEHFRCADIHEQAQRIVRKLEVQLRAYPDELLGVVSPRVEELHTIWSHIQNSTLGPSAVLEHSGQHMSFSESARICVCTVHSIKGLEVRALHISCCEFLNRFSLSRNMAFTAVTRAKTSLSLYYADDIHGFLEGALKALEPLPDLPEIEDLFTRERTNVDQERVT